MSLRPRDVFLGVGISEIRKMNSLAGENTLNLGIGQLPDDLPPSMIERGTEAFTTGKTRYTSNQGLIELRELIASYHTKKSGKDITPEQVVITNGAEGALWNILYTFMEKDDSLLIPEIAFSAYEAIVKLQGASVDTFRYNKDFSIDFNDLEKSITGNTKFLLITSPNNPTGQIISSNDLKRLAVLAEKRDFYIISDEIYSELYYEERPESPLKYSDRVIIVDGISKRAAATGLRIGWSVAPVEITKPMIVSNQYISTCATTTSQYAAIASLNGSCSAFVEGIKSDLREKRDYAYTILSSIEGVVVEKSQGAFYIFPDISKFGSSREVAHRILNETDVLTIPGIAFGESGDDYIRLSFAVDFDLLKEALNRIKKLLESWS